MAFVLSFLRSSPPQRQILKLFLEAGLGWHYHHIHFLIFLNKEESINFLEVGRQRRASKVITSCLLPYPGAAIGYDPLLSFPT